MASRVKLTTLVDVDLKSGKVNPTQLRQELPKLLEGAMASLPGLEAVISPDLKLGKVDVKKLQKELNDLLSAKKFDNSIGSAGFKELEQDVLRYKTALEKVASIQTTLKANKPLRDNLSALQSGGTQFSQLSSKSQEDVRAFQSYLTGVTATWKEIQSGFSKTASVIQDPEIQKNLANAQRRLRTADRAVEKAKKVEAQAKAVYEKAVSTGAPLGKVEPTLAKRQEQLERAESKRTQEQNAVKNLKSSLALGSPTVGATIDPTLVKMTESMVNFNKTLNDKIKQDKKELDQDQKRLKTEAQKRAVTQDFGSKPLTEQSNRDLKDFKTALLTQKSGIKSAAIAKGELFKDRLDFTNVNSQLDAIEKELKRRVEIERKSNRDAKAREERVKRSVLLRRGREVVAETPNVAKTPSSDIEARKAYTQTLRDSAVKKATAIGRQLGTSSAEYLKASKRVDKLNESLFRLGHAGKFAHPIITQLGRLLLQFARFGVGYAALYKFTNAIKELSSAVVNLEDDLKGIQAITGTTDTAMTSMAQTIKGIANTTSFGLGDIAEAVKIIAQAGVDLKDIPKTALAVANLATATSTTLQTAADVITTTQSVWDNLDPVTISDRITQAANVSKLAVEDLKTIFSLGSSFFKSGNLSLDQTLGTIATLRNSGVKPSTIGTGTRQLLLELGAPDKKFSKFLSAQYKSIGESVSASDAAKRFEGFKLTDNPLVSALNELKRIGADSVESLSALQRAVDRRALNVLTPLLNNTGQLQSQTASFSFAPTARDAAVTAMDSLKKASENLNDGFQTLASTVTKDALPALADIVRSITEGVHKLDTVIADIQLSGGKLNGGFTLAGAVAGGVAGAKKGTGLTKLLTGATGAVLGGLGASAVDVGLKSTTGGKGNTLLDILNISFFTTMAMKTLKRVFSVEAIGGAFKKAEGPLTKVIGARLAAALPALTIPVVGEVLGAILSVVTAAFSVKDIYDRFSASNVKKVTRRKLDALFEKQARELNRAQVTKQDYVDILPPQAGKPVDPSTSSGAFLLNNEALNSLRLRVSQELGVVITEDANTQVLQLLDEIRKNGTEQGPTRDKLIAELSTKLGASKKLSESALQGLLVKTGKVSGAFQAQMTFLADTYDKLLNNIGDLTPKESQQLEVLSKLRNTDQAYKDLLVGRSASEDVILKAFRAYLSGMQLAVKDKLNQTDLAVKQLTEVFKQYQITAETDTTALDRLSIEISKKLKQGVDEFGIKFLASADEIISGITKDVGGTEVITVGKAIKRVHTPKLVPDLITQKKVKEATQQTVIDISRNRQDSNFNALTEITQQLRKFQENTKNDTTTNPNREALKATVAQASPQILELISRSQQLRDGFSNATAKDLPTLRAEQQKLAEDIARQVDARLLTRDSKNKLIPGQALKGVTIVNTDAAKKAAATQEVKPFVGSDRYVQNKREVKAAERLAEKYNKEAPNLLTGKGSDNPLILIRDKLVQNLQEEIKHIANQPYKEGVNKDRLIQVKKDQQQEVKRSTEKKVETAVFEVAASAYKASLKTIDAELSQSIKNRDKFNSLGDTNSAAKQNTKIAKLLKQKEQVEIEALKVTRDKKDQDAEILDITRKIKQKREQQLGLDATIKSLEANIKFVKGGATGNEASFNKGVDKSLGRQSVAAESAKLSAEVLAISQAIKVLEDKKKVIAGDKAKAKPGANLGTFDTQIETANKRIEAFYKSLGIAAQDLADFSPTLLKEIQKISAENIGSQLQDLPQSLKNFGGNTEKRVVGAVDSFAGAIADSSLSLVKSLFGIEKASNAASDALSNVLDAQGNKALLVQNRVLVADRINSIKRNEADPARQEILIKQAMDAQKRSEEIAQLQIDAARQAYDQKVKENKPKGLLSKVGTIGSDLVSGIATDAIKGQVINSFSKLFGFGGKLGETERNAMWVQFAKDNPIGDAAKKVVGDGSSSGGVLSSIGGAFKSAGDYLFGSSADTTTSAGSTTKQAKDLQEGVTTALEKPWYKGMTTSISDNLGSFVDNLGGEFATFTTALGTLMGLNYKAPGYQTPSWLSTTQGVLGLITSVAGAAGGGSGGGGGGSNVSSGIQVSSANGGAGNYFGSNVSLYRARGGAISGPGTTTSDSIPVMLSDQEYVLNAKAVKLIGKDVLDQWNFNLKSPAKFATGGFVGDMKNAMSGLSNATPTKQDKPYNAEQQGTSVRVVLVDDQRKVADYLGTSAGEKTLLNFVRKNSTAVRNLIK